MDEVRYMISEAAKKLQVESHVLRYWEEELELEIGRTDMGHRYYTEDDIQLFLCIQKLKNEGMLLRDLKYMIPELTATRKRLNAAKLEKEPDSGGQPGDAAPEQEPGTGAETVKKAAADLLEKASAAADTQGDSVSENDLAVGNDGAPDAGADISPASGNAAENVSAKSAASESVSLASTRSTVPEADVIQVTQLEQVRSLIGDVLTDVVSANNETLKKDISRKVTADVIREMDFLFQANERREEEHYRKLDVLIRQQQAGRREAARETPLGKLKKLLT